jgi:hypothetical protein
MQIKAITRSSKKGEIPAHYDGWLRQRFGDCVAQISTDICLKLRFAVHDVARFFWRHCSSCGPAPQLASHCPGCGRTTQGYVPEDVVVLSTKFEEPPQGVEDIHHVLGYETDEGWVPGSIERDQALNEYIAAHKDEWEVVKKCLGLPRAKGRHPCGFVIANDPISDWIPMLTVAGERCTAFDAGAVEAAGGVKMDFLVIKILRAVGTSIRLLQERQRGGHLPDAVIGGLLVPGQRLVPVGDGVEDIWDLPGDADVFADICAGRTETVFQFNTPGAIQWLAHFNHRKEDGTTAINSIKGMAAFTALDRPGPLDVEISNPDGGVHNMLVEYARRARGAAPSTDVLPVFDELLPETHGVMVYQEQLQRIYQHLTGCDGPEAEEFRSNVAKKLKEKVDAAYPGFIERAAEKLGSKEIADSMWQFFRSWAAYGFNLSHATCYAVIAYACAYLKRKAFLEWWCAVLRKAEKDDINSKFWRTISHLVDLPDVKHSGSVWQIHAERLRAPLSLLHGVGESAHAQLVKYSPYSSLQHFCQSIRDHQEATKGPKTRKKRGVDEYETVILPGRNALHRGIVFTLVVSGAMDSLFPPDYGLNDRLAVYEKTMKEIYGKKWKTPKKGYPVLDPISHYQTKKGALPAWGGDLRKPVALEILAGQHAGVLDVKDGRLRMVWTRHWNGETQTSLVPVVDGDHLGKLNSSPELPRGGWVCAAVGYVEAVRDFQFHGRTKHARDLTVDVGGAKYSFVRWPEDDGSLAEDVRSVEDGSVVAMVLMRTRPDRSFAIKSICVIRGKIKKKEEDEDDEE